MHCNRFLSGLALILWMTWSGAAMAQQALPAPTRIEVTQPARILPTRARLAAEQWETPGGMSVLGQEAWQERRASTVKDMLQYTPGVSVQPRNGAEAARLSIRGSGLTRTFQGRGLLLLQDDIPINIADGSFDFQAIDPWLIDRVAVDRGANALRNGASTLGGAIRFFTPDGADAAGPDSRAELGSFGHAHGLLAEGVQFGEGDAYAALSGFHEDGFRNQNQQDSLRFNGNTSWRLSPNLESRLTLGRIESEGEIPGTLTKAQLRADPRQANPANLAGDYARALDITRLGSTMRWHEAGQSLETTLFWSGRDLENPSTTFIDGRSDDLGIRNRYTVEQSGNRWSLGLNGIHGTADEERYRNIRGDRGARVVTRDQDASGLDAFAELDHAFSIAWHGTAGMLVSGAQRRIEESFPARQRLDADYWGANPRLGLRYVLDPEVEIFSNLSRSFEPPTLSELSGGNGSGFTELDAQSAATGEIGSRGRWRGLDWEAAYYRAGVENEFITYRFADGSTQTVNAADSIHQGIEFGGDAALAESLWTRHDALSMKFAYQWNDFRLRDDPVYGDNRIPGAPPHEIRSELTYRHPSGWYGGPNIEWVPVAYDIDLANTVRTDPYLIAGLTAGWRPAAGHLSFSLDLRNLFDRHYIATTGAIPDARGQDQSQFYPGDGRALYAQLRMQW